MIDPELKQMGEALKKARENAGLTQAQLGERIGVQSAQISKIESGCNITIATLVRVIKALGLSATFKIEGFDPIALAVR